MTGLFSVLEIDPPQILAIVGSGGKTSLMYALAEEALARGLRAITTTTTKIFPPRPEQSPTVILTEKPDDLIAEAGEALVEHRHVTVAAGQLDSGKLDGIKPEMVGLLLAHTGADMVIVEADGARGLPLKAPAIHEPVIPGLTELVVPVVGLSGLGRPLDEDTVFRSEIFSDFSGIALGQAITAEGIGRALFHPDGLLRRVGVGTRVIPLLNQADLIDGSIAHSAARAILTAGAGRTAKVVIASLARRPVELKVVTS
jgi:probable selenium-dependent hydroxylase accessory protein YqeC